MADDERERVTSPPRLAMIITATLLGGLIAGVALIGSEAFEPKLTDASREALREAGITGVDVRFDGREAFLSPVGATAEVLAEAEGVVESVPGVRWATIEKADAAAVQPALTASLDADGDLVVEGLVGTAEQASAIQEAVTRAFGSGAVADLTVTDGVAIAPWTESAPELFAALVQVGDLEFSLGTDGATLAGSAADPDAVNAAVQAALGEIPLTSTLEQAGPTEAEAATINGTVVRFTADSVTLDAAARKKVAALADALRRFPTIGVNLTGHIAIPVGTEDDAIAFSLRRAQAVADALVAAGIDAERIDIFGAGSSDPVGDNSTAEGAAANRRVTVLIMEGS